MLGLGCSAREPLTVEARTRRVRARIDNAALIAASSWLTIDYFDIAVSYERFVEEIASLVTSSGKV